MAAPWLAMPPSRKAQQLERIGQIVPRFVKQAVAQAGADDGGQCPVNEYRVGELCGKPLSLAELYEKEGSEPMAMAHITPYQRMSSDPILMNVGLKCQTTVRNWLNISCMVGLQIVAAQPHAPNTAKGTKKILFPVSLPVICCRSRPSPGVSRQGKWRAGRIRIFAGMIIYV